MSKTEITHSCIENSVDPISSNQTKDHQLNAEDGRNGKSNEQEQQQFHEQQKSKNVRQIPIYVEGRDEPLMNNVDLGASFGSIPAKSSTNFTHDIPKTGSSIYSRAKDIPVRVIPNFDSSTRRSTSPSFTRNIPIQVQHSANKSKSTQQQVHHQQQNYEQNEEKIRKSPSPSSQQHQPSQIYPQDPITKIQLIQNEVIHLMEKVEQFNGIKNSKEYVYLDEMLTQNLLKLDTIDTDGKENIKAARKEVVNCINKCIAGLESKASEASSTNRNPEQNESRTTGTT